MCLEVVFKWSQAKTKNLKHTLGIHAKQNCFIFLLKKIISINYTVYLVNWTVIEMSFCINGMLDCSVNRLETIFCEQRDINNFDYWK